MVTNIDKQLGFSFEAGSAGKKAGIDRVEEHNLSFVELMRREARRIARATGKVSSDDLRRYARVSGLEPEHPNCWGSVFRGPEWVCIGRMKSKLVSNHAREIRVWAQKETE